jgi:hypothetical protein
MRTLRTGNWAIQQVGLGVLLTVLLSGGCAATQPGEPYHALELQGFPVRVDNTWRQSDPEAYEQVISTLNQDLETIARIVPPPALAALRTRTIWIEGETGIAADTFTGRGLTFHPAREWLTEHGLLPEKAGGVEISNAQDYLEWRQHQPFMVLHELAHAYHWLLGFERPDVVQTYEYAKAAGLYEEVDYVLATGGEKRRAYALTNPKEYFAELSEAYFGRNDFFPYTREELREYDPAGYALVERLWHLDPAAIQAQREQCDSADARADDGRRCTPGDQPSGR